MGYILIGGVIFFIILYFVIQMAVDNSYTAQNIRLVREHLVGKTADEIEEDIEEQYDITEIPINKCPACLSEVKPGDKECSSCGLYLGN